MTKRISNRISQALEPPAIILSGIGDEDPAGWAFDIPALKGVQFHFLDRANEGQMA